MNKNLKHALILLCCVAMLATLLVACKPTNITVTFDPNYENATLLPRTGRAGSSFQAPTVTRDGYEFDGWYKTKELSGTAETFPQNLTSDTTFYAKWNIVASEPDPTPTPDPDPTPDPAPDPEPVVLASITAVYGGASIIVGEQPDTSLLTVTAHYSDGSSKTVTNFATGSIDSSTVGEKDWEVSYTEEGVTKSYIVKIKVISGKVADMSIHFITSGNLTSGDSIYIKAGDTDILIDAGSSASCAKSIESYVKKYCTDGILEYVIVTHEDSDHISGFTYSLNSGGGIFERFICETIIDFPLTSKSSSTLTTYIERRDAEVEAGANHYTALQCYNNENGAKRIYDLADGITMEILYHNYYVQKQSEANNNSVCVLFTQGDNHYLFTGDLEEAGERSLVENNPNLPEVELFKAGHHGSQNASNTELLNVVKPKNIVISCIAGDKYNFPQQVLIDRIANYTEHVYVTGMKTDSGVYADMNGNIVFSCVNGVIEINAYNSKSGTELSLTKLKDTAWFATNRSMPDSWA